MVFPGGRLMGMVSGAIPNTTQHTDPTCFYNLLKNKARVFPTVSSVVFYVSSHRGFSFFVRLCVVPNPILSKLADIAYFRLSELSTNVLGIEPKIACFSYSSVHAGSGRRM